MMQEFQAYGKAMSNDLLSQGKRAYASSVYSGLLWENANDGKLDTVFISRYPPEFAPWWGVDLGPAVSWQAASGDISHPLFCPRAERDRP